MAIFDSDIDTQQRITYVATDNREGGRMAARTLGELLLGEGKVAVIGFMPGSAATMEREEGFRRRMKKSFPNVQIVQTVYGMADRAKARAATENMLAAHPDLRGLFADNESSSAGAVHGVEGSARCAGADCGVRQQRSAGCGYAGPVIDALVIQNPFQMGYESVKALGG